MYSGYLASSPGPTLTNWEWAEDEASGCLAILTKFLAISPNLQIDSKRECIQIGLHLHCAPQCISYWTAR